MTTVEKGQKVTMICKTIHGSTKRRNDLATTTPLKSGVHPGAAERLAVPVPLVIHVVSEEKYINFLTTNV